MPTNRRLIGCLFLFILLASRTLAEDVIVFVSNRTGPPGTDSIYRVNADGTDLRDLTPGWPATPTLEWSPSISPDGQWVAFIAQHLGLWRMRVDGSDRQLVTTPAEVHLTDWSSDGQHIFYDVPATCAEDLYRVRIDGSDRRRVVDAGVQIPQPVVYRASRSVNDELAVVGTYCWGNVALYVMNVDGTDVRPFLANAYDADWSPDGNRLAIHGTLLSPDGRNHIWTVNRDGSGLTRLTPATGHDYGYPDWSPDGSQIAFARFSGGTAHLFVMNADGSDSRQITFGDGARDFDPVWARVSSPPVALCRDVTLPANAACAATVQAADIDAGSSDPDGTAVSLSLDGAGPFPLGEHQVRLTVVDGSGESASCTARVTVEDAAAPYLQVSGPACVQEPPGRGNLDNRLSIRAVDNCSGQPSATVASVGVLNGAGTLVQGDGVARLSGLDVLVRPAGAGWSVVIAAHASDDSGNVADQSFRIPLRDCRKR